jgi:threonine synthase
LTIASAVSDDDIRRAMHDLAAEGLFVEPSGSIAVAGRPNHGSDESSLVIDVRFA